MGTLRGYTLCLLTGLVCYICVLPGHFVVLFSLLYRLCILRDFAFCLVMFWVFLHLLGMYGFILRRYWRCLFQLRFIWLWKVLLNYIIRRQGFKIQWFFYRKILTLNKRGRSCCLFWRKEFLRLILSVPLVLWYVGLKLECINKNILRLRFF